MDLDSAKKALLNEKSAPKKRLHLWYDATRGSEKVLSRIPQVRYTGVLTSPERLDEVSKLSGRLDRIVVLSEESQLQSLPSFIPNLIVASDQEELLSSAKKHGLPTCLRSHVDSGESLHRAIERGAQHAYLMVSFKDPTNIPLELAIASLQATQTTLIKEIQSPNEVDDAVVTLGVMEVGAEGVMFTPTEHSHLDSFLAKLSRVEFPQVQLEVGTVTASTPIGMGHRSCIDLATLFTPTEGMIVGSTSHGGVLCCSEVFFLPYMDLRPFRVNAGGVHSYVYNLHNKTNYMTELKAGSPVMIVDTQGRARKAAVGRIKTEIRPLRLIEIEFSGGRKANVILQDDWHVRIFSDEGLPLNITELKVGSKVLGHPATAGRHVGLQVEENILEN